MAPFPRRVSLGRVAEARAAIAPVFLDTPQFMPEGLGRVLGTRLLLKLETLNPVRSFKGRSAEWLVANARPRERLVCASAGNFGQAMAYSCRRRAIPLTVYMSEDANPYKMAMTRSFGAEVMTVGADFDDAKIAAREQAVREGARFVEDCLDIESLEGAATIALELLRADPPVDVVLVAVGNGALFNGVARVMKAARPEVEMVVVQAEGAPSMVDSLRAGRPVAHASVDTIADGIAVRIPVEQALRDMEGLVDRTVLVSDAQILHGMRLLHEHAGVVAEPSAAVGVAALLADPTPFTDRTVASIVCGGNLTREQARAWLH